MAEMQIQLFLLLTTRSIPLPTTPENYHLLHAKGSRIQYGVDYSTYQATLARDMGAAPGLRELWWEYGWFVVLVYW
jgi:dimethylaniline monooxygenase (N-oxide forming)